MSRLLGPYERSIIEQLGILQLPQYAMPAYRAQCARLIVEREDATSLSFAQLVDVAPLPNVNFEPVQLLYGTYTDADGSAAILVLHAVNAVLSWLEWERPVGEPVLDREPPLQSIRYYEGLRKQLPQDRSWKAILDRFR